MTITIVGLKNSAKELLFACSIEIPRIELGFCNWVQSRKIVCSSKINNLTYFVGRNVTVLVIGKEKVETVFGIDNIT